jgi:hypothetical protein
VEGLAEEVVTPTDAPRAVSRFEFHLLRLLRFFLGRFPADQALPLLAARHARPKCLSADCVHLVKDSLSKGAVVYLVRAGGWRDERFLRDGRPANGRLWQRTPVPELALEFSPHALGFLIWVTAESVGDTRTVWQPPAAELTVADGFLLFLAYDAIRADADTSRSLRTLAPFRTHPLCWLANPDDFADADDAPAPDFGPWAAGQGAAVLEALQPLLLSRWLAVERSKGQVSDWQQMRGRGRAQSRVLEAFLTAAEQAGRPDLARFLLQTAAQVLAGPEPSPAFWTGGLLGNPPVRLADRLETQRSALAVLQHMATLQRWERQARSVGYYDEGYAASQFWKAHWERFGGDEAAARSERVLHQLEPLRLGGAGGLGSSPAPL